MKYMMALALLTVPMMVWGQSGRVVSDCKGRVRIEGAACMVSNNLLVTSYSLIEYADENTLRISMDPGGSGYSYKAKMVESNPIQGWCVLKIEDPYYNKNMKIKYGVTNNPLKTCFYMEENGGISEGKLTQNDSRFYLGKSVTRDAFDTPLEGTPVFDNAGCLIGIVTNECSSNMAFVLSISNLRETLADYGVRFRQGVVDGSPSEIRSVMQPYMVKLQAEVLGNLLYDNYCTNYQEALLALDSKNYSMAKEYFVKARNSKRIPRNHDINEQVALCDYWICRNKGDEYAKQYKVTSKN